MAEDNNDLADLRQRVKEELETARNRVAHLERAYEALEATGPSNKYSNLSKWVAIRQYLKNVGQATISDIADELQHGGADLGKYPLRTVSVSVNSAHVKNIFKVQKVGGDTIVSLREKGDSSKNPPRKR